MREKIYCTGCGREIQDGLLYCDRCGQSVKKSIQQQRPLKYRQIEEIHKERRERKKRQQEQAIKRKQQKQKALKRTRILVFILVLLVAALVSAITAFVKMSGDGGMKDMDDVIRENVEATEQPTQSPETNVVITTMLPDVGDYTEFAVSGQTISYPSTFVSTATQSGETARFKDPSGDAEITVGQETVSGSASDMMLEYFSKTGLTGEPDVNSANKTRYLITYTKDGKVTHRKLVIKNGAAVYYDFTYSASSSDKNEYEKYISEMDTLFSE